MTEIYIFDSDGDRAVEAPQDNVDTALRRAAKLVCGTWPDWARATIAAVTVDREGKEIRIPLAIVQRMGPRGSNRVGAAVAGAEWFRIEWVYVEERA